MRYLTKKDVVSPKREEYSHKGDNGRVLVIGGSEDYAGAPYLAAMAAVSLRTGCDLATVAAPDKVAWAINSLCPDLITKKLTGKRINAEHYATLKNLIQKNDVVVIGPGIGLYNDTKKIIKEIIKETKKHKVIDADAIKSVSLHDAGNAIITPHHREFNILFNNSFNKKIRGKCRTIESRIKFIKNNKKIKDNIILIKGKTDIIISKNKTAHNKTGNSGMTVGGTGDILSGLCAGFLSQGLNLFDSACNAAYLNGIIGDKLKKKSGHGFIASDFLSEIAVEMKKLC